MQVQVTNDTMHDIVLPGRTVLGSFELIRSVTPIEVKLKENADEKRADMNFGMEKQRTSQTKDPCHSAVNSEKEQFIPQVNLSYLTPEQQTLVKKCCMRSEILFQSTMTTLGASRT
jgi:hypothetical protein